MPEYTALISHIVQLRKQSGMTQKQLAQAAHLTQPAIARLESQANVPQLDTFMKVLAALGQKIKVVPMEE